MGAGVSAGATSCFWSLIIWPPSFSLPHFHFVFLLPPHGWEDISINPPFWLYAAHVRLRSRSPSLSPQHPRGGPRVMIRSIDDSIGHWRAALETQQRPLGLISFLISEQQGWNFFRGKLEEIEIQNNAGGGGGRVARQEWAFRLKP